MKCMMNHAMGEGAAHGAAKVIASAGSQVSHGVIGKLIRNPVVLISAGIVTGYLIHKYRKEVISDN